MMKEYANQKYSDWAYDVIVGSSMWAYISHYFFIVLSSNFIIRPLSLDYYSGVITNLLFTWVCIFLSNIVLEKLLSHKQEIKRIGLSITNSGSSKKR